MALYENLSDITNEIIGAFKDNDDFKRLVGNDGRDALSASIPDFNELVVSEVSTENSYFNRICPYLKPLDPKIEKGTYVMVYYRNGGFAGASNIYQHDARFYLDFLCHKDNWFLDNKVIRTYQLLGVIYKQLDSLRLTQAIRGQLVVSAPEILITHNGEYSGYRFSLELTGQAKC